MQINNRLEDLSQVFDRTWKANHNDDIQRERAKEKQFMNKMFDVKNNDKIPNNGFKTLNSSEQLQNRQNNMNSMNDFNNKMRLNNIKGKFN